MTARIPVKGLANVHAKLLELNVLKGASVGQAKESHARINLPINQGRQLHFNGSLLRWK